MRRNGLLKMPKTSATNEKLYASLLQADHKLHRYLFSAGRRTLQRFQLLKP
jgi:hypothetical protein